MVGGRADVRHQLSPHLSIASLMVSYEYLDLIEIAANLPECLANVLVLNEVMPRDGRRDDPTIARSSEQIVITVVCNPC